METKQIGRDRFYNEEWNMNKDAKFFGEREIQIINNTKNISFQIQLEDLHERIIICDTEYHIVKIIINDLNGNKIMSEEIFDKSLNPYLDGIQAMIYINSRR